MAKLHQHQRHNIILERLNNGETLSITELSIEWDIPTKTVQRDFKKLMEGNYGVIRANDGKRFCISGQHGISKHAITTLKMLDSLSADIGGAFYTRSQPLLNRLEKYIDSPFYTRIDVEDISSKMEMIQTLEEAIASNRQITFRYKRWYKPDDIRTYRYVHPYKIIIFNGFWYLLAKSGELFIKYYLKEISDLQVEPQTFKPDEKIIERMEKALDIWFDPSKEPFDVTLLLDSDAVVYFERKPLKGQYLKKNKDTTAELTISITNKEEVFTLLKKWLPQIRVIEPYALQQEFEGMMRAYLA
ncbi:MAG TPA: WYL domain-containing transcriptional regulator [Epsilonproteobacteria bacterium]|nr:WYL domain-containing transcriptional regulator [Campylobacterota bacterium]